VPYQWFSRNQFRISNEELNPNRDSSLALLVAARLN
jgi:hypothetical protein